MKISVYLCGCSGNISEKLDLSQMQRKIAGHPDIAYVKVYELMCSTEGLNVFMDDLRSAKPDRIVIAACSPLDREDQFRQALEESNINPYLMQMVNIREQVAWVTKDPERATHKAVVLINAALKRLHMHQPLEKKSIAVCPDIMVIGAGPAGLSSALTLAEAGRSVVLVEKSPAAGGKPAMFDEIFPDMECGPCLTSPLINEVLHGVFPGSLELLTLTRAVSVRGYFGNFTVTLERRARFVDDSSCISCGECVAACPVTFRPDSDLCHNKRRAIDFASSGALPHVPFIDASRCVRTSGEECWKCRDACPVEGAIVYEDVARTMDRRVGAIVVATGASQLDCSRFANLGYGRNPDVVTAMEFERILTSEGPRKGRPVTSSFRAPNRIAIIQCVGSLDPAHKPYCSAVCCRYALKYSAMIRKRLPETEVIHFVREWCLPGQSASELFGKAVDDSGTTFVRYRDLASFKITSSSGKNKITFRDDGGSLRRSEADMVILCPAIVPDNEAAALAVEFGIECDEQGFFETLREKATSVESAVRGVYAAGACRTPMDIRSSVNEGQAASGRILAELKTGGMIDIPPTTATVDAMRCSGCMLCIPLCPYKAISSDSSTGKAAIIEELCRGCGICVSSCPAQAIEGRHFTSEELIAEIKGLLQEDRH